MIILLGVVFFKHLLLVFLIYIFYLEMSIAQVMLTGAVVSSFQAQFTGLPGVPCMMLNKLFPFSVLLELHLYNDSTIIIPTS